jgi:hypothetical protein
MVSTDPYDVIIVGNHVRGPGQLRALTISGARRAPNTDLVEDYIGF